MYAKFTQLKAEVILTIQVLRRYWFSNLVGFFVDLVYFYAIFVAVRSLVPGENLPGTPSLILMYTVLHLTLGFYTSFYRFLRNDALQGTLEHLALARGGLLSQLFVRLAVQGAYIILQSLLVLLILVALTKVSLEITPWWPLGVGVVLLAAVGLSLLMGALGLYFKEIDNVFTLIQFILIPYFLSFIQWQPYMAYLPFAPGAHLVRLGLTGGDFDRGIFLLALFQGLFLFAAGLLAMVYMYRMVRRWGILGRF
jgi:ABC-2 type transport system permease protein